MLGWVFVAVLSDQPTDTDLVFRRMSAISCHLLLSAMVPAKVIRRALSSVL